MSRVVILYQNALQDVLNAFEILYQSDIPAKVGINNSLIINT